MNFTFTTRIEYKQQRAEWSAEYDAACANIRTEKLNLKDAMRQVAKGARVSVIHEALLKLHRARQIPPQLLTQLWGAKREAQSQYLASKVAA